MEITLRDYMHIKQFTVKQLAEELHCSYPYMSAIVNGKIKPSRRFAEDIKRLTNVNIPWSKKKDKVQLKRE
jgi:transcriptional regulator with XRE-family HTH domain